MKVGRHLLLAPSVASVAYLVATTGVERLLGPVRTLSWRIAVFIALPYALVAFLHTVAWRLIFVRRPFSLRQLFSVRLAGEAVNLGTASVGGEPVKVYLLRPWVPMAEASAALVVDKTAITIGQVLFLAAGLVVAVGSFPLRPDFLRAMAALLGLQIVVVAAFVLVQYAGLGGWTLRALDRLGFGSARARMSGLVRFDRMLAASYRERPGAVLACVLVHLVGWLVGSLEVYLVLRWLNVSASFGVALAIDAFGTGIKFLAFSIPGALGVLEGGYMLVFSAFGLGGGLGLSFTLIRRLRMLAWSAAGLKHARAPWRITAQQRNRDDEPKEEHAVAGRAVRSGVGILTPEDAKPVEIRHRPRQHDDEAIPRGDSRQVGDDPAEANVRQEMRRRKHGGYLTAARSRFTSSSYEARLMIASNWAR